GGGGALASMRTLVLGCASALGACATTSTTAVQAPVQARRFDVFAMVGGKIEIDLRPTKDGCDEIATNTYVAPVSLLWPDYEKLTTNEPGDIFRPFVIDATATRLLAHLSSAACALVAPTTAYRGFFGSPDAKPTPYAYQIPFPAGITAHVSGVAGDLTL